MDEENRGDSLQSPLKNLIITNRIIIKFLVLSIPNHIFYISLDSSNNKETEKLLEPYGWNNTYEWGVYFLYWGDQRESWLCKNKELRC